MNIYVVASTVEQARKLNHIHTGLAMARKVAQEEARVKNRTMLVLHGVSASVGTDGFNMELKVVARFDKDGNEVEE